LSARPTISERITPGRPLPFFPNMVSRGIPMSFATFLRLGIYAGNPRVSTLNFTGNQGKAGRISREHDLENLSSFLLLTRPC
jgi:hypothetical protein